MVIYNQVADEHEVQCPDRETTPAPTPTRYVDGNPKAAEGAKKPSLMSVIPLPALLHLGSTMRLGAEKYGPFNWRKEGQAVSASTYVDAAMRHMGSWWDGESIDPESGASHLAHAMACMAILLDAAETNQLIDDRPPQGPTAELIRKHAETGSLAA